MSFAVSAIDRRTRARVQAREGERYRHGLCRCRLSAEILEEHTSKYGDTAYRIRFLTQAPIPEYPEDWFPSRWITARLVGLDTARRMYEKSLNSGHLTQELAQAAREVLKRSDSELLEFAQGFFIDMHNAGALIPMLLQSGFLKKGQILD